jgi:hypothetical protein
VKALRLELPGLMFPIAGNVQIAEDQNLTLKWSK